jgi:uncharacterized protein involved in outer membrane biogenesis
MGSLLKKVLIGLAIVAVLVGLYAFLGFKVAPGFVRNKAIEYVRNAYGRELTLGEIRIHPFKLQFEARDIAFPDADGERMLGLARLFVDFDLLSSIWKRALYFSDVDLESPYVRAMIRPDGAMNLADLAPKKPPAEEARPEEDEEPFTVWIADLDVTDGTVDYLDRARTQPFEKRFEPVAFALQDFKTTPEGGEFKLSARSQHDEQFAWQGHIALAPVVSSEGQFTIDDLQATGVGEFLGELSRGYDLSGGSIDLGGNYRLALGQATELDLKLPRIAVDALSLRAPGVEEDWIRVPSLAVSDTAVAMPAQTVTIARIEVTGLVAQAWLNEDGSVNLTRVIEEAPTDSTAPPGATTENAPGQAPPAEVPPAPPPPEPKESGDSGWSLTLSSLELADARLELEDRTLSPAPKFVVAPLAVKLTDLSLDRSRPVPLALTARLDEATSVKADGTIVLLPFAADLDVELDALDLRTLQPYVGKFTDMTVRRGTAGAAGKLTLAPPGDETADFGFAGDVRVTGFRSIDDTLKEDFINFERLDLRKLKFAMKPDQLSIDRVTLRKPYARVSISPEQVLNVAAVFDPEGTAAALAERRAQAAADAAEEKTPKKRRASKKATTKKKAPAAPPPREVLVETGWPIRIREVRIESGQMNFSDQFIQPNFAAEIKDLNGTLVGLSTDPNSSAKLDLKGEVGEFSPVTIAGEIQLFAFDRHTDIGMKFENIPLPIFNPYSGRFAGYNIAKGSLTTDLQYLIENRKLDAKHHIRIDQLEWGEATESKEAVPLPIKLATSLLKDVNGMIDLDVPVSGTLDDPKFRIGPIVWKIIKNLLVKAVTFPFRLFGKGAEDAQFVQFAAGEATLEPAAAEQLSTLAKGLSQKPEIKLDIPIGVVEELDRPALVEQALATEVDAATRTVLRIKPGDEEEPPALAALEPKKQIAVLSAVVEQLTGAAPQAAPVTEAPEGTSRKEARAFEQAASLKSLEEQARAAVVVDPLAMQRLGQARGEAIQSALLSGGELQADRVFLARNDKVTAQDGKVRFELGIK